MNRLFRLAIASVLGLAVGAGVALAVVFGAIWPKFAAMRDGTTAMLDAHLKHEVAHPGWSFPARVWSAPASLDLPPARLAFEAEARGYRMRCPVEAPGDYCKKDGTVSPRGGDALEPVLIGWLVGPDSELRTHLPLEDAPDHLIAAIKAAEDDGFDDHHGVDIMGLGRATLANLRGDKVQQGGSTLTMQVVRNLSSDKERTIWRKGREIAASLVADRYLGKDGVMQIYLDAPYLGQDGDFSVCGFQAASYYYWGKTASDLTLGEAATLAAILPAPGKFAPDRAPDVAKERRDRVLKHMLELGWPADEIQAALAEPVATDPHHLPTERYPAYMQATRAALLEALPEDVVYGSGLEVFTGLDVGVQEASDRLLSERVHYLERTTGRRGEGPLLAAGAIVDPWTGALVAVTDTNIGLATDFNRATQARRQAGSSFKPMVYALAFEPGPDGLPAHRADESIINTPHTFPGTDGWSPRNVGGRYSATSSLAYGLAASQNIATASLLAESGGPDALIALADRVGFDTSGFPHEMGLSLGQGQVNPLEMARMVATFVDGGLKIEATPVLRAVDADGSVVLELLPPHERVLSADSARLTAALMALVVQFGTGGSAHGGGGFPGYEGDVIGKTGTANDEKDLWFVGSTPTYSGALWLGYEVPTRIGGSASDLAAPMWGWWMREVHTGLPKGKFPDDGLERHWICNQTGLVPTEGCKGITCPFLPGTRPRGVCPATHAPETGESMEDHVSLWEKLALAREQAEEAAGDGTPAP